MPGSLPARYYRRRGASRPGWRRSGGQPGPSWRKRHGAVGRSRRTGRETARAPQGDRPSCISHGLPLQSGRFRRIRSTGSRPSRRPSIGRESPGDLLVHGNQMLFHHRKRIAELAARSRLPTVCSQKQWVDAGCLTSFGANYVDLYRRAATYVDKILKGANPPISPWSSRRSTSWSSTSRRPKRSAFRCRRRCWRGRIS